MTSRGTGPGLSVLMGVYNDEARVARAIKSVLSQSFTDLELIVVDDASTDGTGRVLARIAREDSRVVVMRHGQNSGGIGRPRNTALAAARGRYVMFIDSDDEFHPGALEGMVTLIAGSGVDVAAGRVDRINPTTGMVRPLDSTMYEQPRVTSLVVDPSLLRDTIVVNKVYRREFLECHNLRFAQDLHYEDQLFTTEILLTADAIAVTDLMVYRWYIHNQPGLESMTARRFMLSNVKDRLEVNRRIDALFDSLRGTHVWEARCRKFVEHDLWLYIRDLPDRLDDYQSAFVQLAADYLDELDPISAVTFDGPRMLMLRLLRQRDARGLVDLAWLMARAGAVMRPLTGSGDRWRWSVEDPSDPIYDVTDLLRADAPHRLTHELTRFTRDRGDLRVELRTLDPFGMLTASAHTSESSMVVQLRDAATGKRVSVSAPVRVQLRSGEWTHWVAHVRGTSLGTAGHDAQDGHFLQVRTDADEGRSRAPVLATIPTVGDGRFAVRTGRFTRSKFEIYTTRSALALVRTDVTAGKAR